MEGWKDGILEGWNAGILERWNAGILEGWNIGRMERWNFGTMECWNRVFEYKTTLFMQFSFLKCSDIDFISSKKYHIQN